MFTTDDRRMFPIYRLSLTQIYPADGRGVASRPLVWPLKAIISGCFPPDTGIQFSPSNMYNHQHQQRVVAGKRRRREKEER